MLTELNPIVALWLIPVVLQVALPMVMLSCWLVVKVARELFEIKKPEVVVEVICPSAVLAR